MNQLDASKDANANPDKLDFVKDGSRVDLLENKVVLVTPEGNPKYPGFCRYGSEIEGRLYPPGHG